MESDGEDFELLESVELNSPPGRRLKRLKKAGDAVAEESPPDLSDAGYEPDDNGEDSGFRQESKGIEEEGLGFEGEEERREESGVGVKRALEFDSSDEGRSEGAGHCRGGEEGSEDEDDGGRADSGDVGGDGDDLKRKKEKKERKKSRVERNGVFSVGSEAGDFAAGHTSPVPKRVSEKMRRNQLTQLRANSQRLLRESRDVGFKPVPLVHKPISSVLEKIRQRKLELAKKTVPVKKGLFAFPFSNLVRDGDELIVDSEEIEMKTEVRTARVITGNSDVTPEDVNSLHDDGSIDASREPKHVDVSAKLEGIKQTYRSPGDDTQDLFSDSECDYSKDDHDENLQRLTEEVFAPSVLAMNLKLDSAPQDESSDEDDNDKENINPLLHQSDDLSSASLGDPVKNLIDVEAEEEDDSDNDMNRFQENEEEDVDDSEELNDMIAPDYKEGNVDMERRNELHQKWLEQQDAAGTDNLLQRLNCVPKKTTACLDDMVDDEEDETQNYDESEDDLAPGNAARVNFRKVQQMIPQMFTDNEDAYISSEDEEFEKRVAKQNLLLKTEFQGALISPAEDEDSREVFQLIKKLNIVHRNKKHSKSSVRDNTHLGSRANDLLKPSFLGRGSKSASSSSKNQKTSSFKGFIFGRDDSNSKGAASTCEDSEMMEQEAKPARTSASAKPRSSQSRHSSQATMDSAATLAASSSSSLYDILRRSSVQTEQRARTVPVDQSKSMFSAFRVRSKSRGGRVGT